MLSTAHQIELKPNNKQANYFARACGVARFSWWGLEQWQHQYQAMYKITVSPNPTNKLSENTLMRVKNKSLVLC